VELLESRFLRKTKKKTMVWLVRTRLELGSIFANETETGIHSFEEPKPNTHFLDLFMCEIKDELILIIIIYFLEPNFEGSS